MPNIPTQSIGIIKVGSVKNALGIKQIESYKKGKVRYNVTDFSTGSFYERVVELKATKTHTQIFKVNRREFYCVVELPLSDYPLYGKQLVARG